MRLREEAGTLSGLLGELAGRCRDAPALVYGDEVISFGELEQRAAGVAGALAALGVGAGDRVALWLPNCPAWFELPMTEGASGRKVRRAELRRLAAEALKDPAPATP